MRPLLGRLGSYLPAAVALALPTVFLPAAEDSFILPRTSIVIAGACLGAGLALIVPSGRRLETLRLPLAAAATAAVLAFAFSISWPLSFAGAYTRYESLPVRLAYLGLFAVAVWLLKEKRPREWVVPAFVFGTSVACLEAIGQWAGHVPYRPDGNLGNANLLAALVAMAFPLAVSRGLRGGLFVVAWWIGAAVLAGGLLTTTSRSGGLGALAGCLVLVVVAFRRRLWIAMSLVASGLVLAAGLWLVTLGPLAFLNNDPPRSRLLLWADALRMIGSRPVTGWGEDATGLIFGRFLGGDWSPGVTFDRIHSWPLDIAATQGLVGIAALGWVVAILFRSAWRWRFSGQVRALTAACIGYTVWVVFNFDWAPATGVFWLLLGTLWSEIRGAETASVQPAPAEAAGGPAAWRSALAVVMVFVAIALGVMPLLADTWYLQGRPDLSVRVDPLQSRYHWSLGQQLVAQGSLAQGVQEMRRAADLGETEPGLYVELGDREAQLGHTAQARADYRRALEIDPYYAPASQKLAAAGS
jgi:O-Antigen ligase